MFCKSCGANNRDGVKFCSQCGAPLDDPQQGGGMNMNQNMNMNGGMNPPPYGAPQQFGFGGNSFAGTFKERNIALCIVFSIITFGIYTLYWFFTLTEDTNRISNDPAPTSGGMALLYTIITCGIYGFYWMYKRGAIIDDYNMRTGKGSTSNAIIYLLLAVFSLGIVSYCLCQNEINKINSGS